MQSTGLDHTSIATSHPGNPAVCYSEQPGFVFRVERDGNLLRLIHRAQPLP